MTVRKFPECETCINSEFDPFQCRGCKRGSNYEGDARDDEAFEEEISYQDLIELVRGVSNE